jgi:DNA-binding FadR family transcriptional regulator
MEASGNSRMRQFEIIVRISSQMLYPRLETDEGRMRKSAMEHAAILRAIEAGDSEAADSLARDHIKSATGRWLSKDDR